MKEKFSIPFLFCLAIFGCHPDPLPQPTPSEPKVMFYRDLFTGKYLARDDSNETYEMTVSTLDSGGLHYLRIANYGNLFDFDMHYGSTYSSDSIPEIKIFGISPSWPVFDHYGNRWQLYSLDDTTTQETENRLVGNKITFHFRLENIKYYYDDSVPYHSASHTHFATKIE